MASSSNDVDVNHLLEQLEQIQSQILAMDPATDLKDVLTLIAERSNALLGGHFCVVQPYSAFEDKFLLDQFSVGGDISGKTFNWLPPRPNGTSRTLLREGLLLVEDYATDPRPFIQTSSANKGAFRDVADIRAMLGVRMEEAGQIFGALFINFLEPHVFAPWEVSLAKLLANQTAIALRNTRLLKRQQLSIEFHTAINEIGRRLSTHDILVQAVAKANQILRADFSVIIPYYQDTDEFRIDEVVVEGKDTSGFEWKEPRPDGATRRLIREAPQEPIIRDRDLDSQDEWARVFSDGTFKNAFNLQTIAGLPLLTRGICVGVMYFGCESKRSFSDDERALIRFFGDECADAIYNGRLFDAERRQRTLADALQHIAQALNERIEQNDILDRILGQVGSVLPFDSATIMLIDERTDEVEVRKERNYTPSLLHQKFKLNDVPNLRRMFSEKQALVERDVTQAKQSGRWINMEATSKTRSYIGAPIIFRGQVRGFVNLDSYQPNTYSDSDKDRLEAFARQAAIALDNVESFKALAAVQETAQRIVAKALRPSLNLNEFLNYVIEETLSLFKFESAQLMLKEGRKIKNVATDKNHPHLIGREFYISDSISGRSMQDRNTIYVPDIEAASEEYKTLYKAPGEGMRFRSELVVPLVIGDAGIGAYNIESSEVDAFDVREQNMMEILSGHVALAIELARSRGEATRLSAVARDLSIKTEPDEIIGLILEHALATVKGNFGQILILEEGGLVIRHVTSNFLVALGRKHPIDGCVSGLAVIEGSPVIVPDVDRTEYTVIEFDDAGDNQDLVVGTVSKYAAKLLYQDPSAKKNGALKMRSELVVPIMVDGKAIGVLNMESPEEEFFTQEHARILRAFARQVAGALGRAQLQQQKDAERKVALQSEFAQRFAAGFTHSVRSPSSGILTDIQFMRGDFANLLKETPALDDYLKGIEEEARKINRLPNEIAKRAREFTRIRTTSKEWIGNAFQLVNASESRAINREKVLGMVSYDESINDPAVFEIDTASHLVIENLLINAVEATERAGIANAQIKIGTRRTSDGLFLDVWVQDNGPGVPDPNKHIIFEHDFSSRPVAGGVGLWWVKNQLESYGARIWVEDAPVDPGARFVIRFRILSGGDSI